MIPHIKTPWCVSKDIRTAKSYSSTQVFLTAASTLIMLLHKSFVLKCFWIAILRWVTGCFYTWIQFFTPFQHHYICLEEISRPFLFLRFWPLDLAFSYYSLVIIISVHEKAGVSIITCEICEILLDGKVLPQSYYNSMESIWKVMCSRERSHKVSFRVLGKFYDIYGTYR